jgi:hypothetical protein
MIPSLDPSSIMGITILLAVLLLVRFWTRKPPKLTAKALDQAIDLKRAEIARAKLLRRTSSDLQLQLCDLMAAKLKAEQARRVTWPAMWRGLSR